MGGGVEGGRERERERERERGRDRQADRQTDRQTRTERASSKKLPSTRQIYVQSLKRAQWELKPTHTQKHDETT